MSSYRAKVLERCQESWFARDVERRTKPDYALEAALVEGTEAPRLYSAAGLLFGREAQPHVSTILKVIAHLASGLLMLSLVGCTGGMRETCSGLAGTKLHLEFYDLPVWPKDRPVPASFDDAIEALGVVLSDRQRKIAACHDPAKLATATHHTLGLWVRNSWGLWAGSGLIRNAEANGFHHPDDVSATLIRLYARRLQGLTNDLEAQIAAYDRWRQGIANDSPSEPGVVP